MCYGLKKIPFNYCYSFKTVTIIANSVLKRRYVRLWLESLTVYHKYGFT